MNIYTVRVIRNEQQVVQGLYIKEFWMLCGVYVREYIAEQMELISDVQCVDYNIFLTTRAKANSLKAKSSTIINVDGYDDLSNKDKRTAFGKSIKNALLQNIADANDDIFKVYDAFVERDYAFLDYTAHIFLSQFNHDKKVKYMDKFLCCMKDIYPDNAKFTGSKYKKFAYLNIGRKINRIARAGSLRLCFNTTRLMEEAHSLEIEDYRFTMADVLAGFIGLTEYETERLAREYLHNSGQKEAGCLHSNFLHYQLGCYYETRKKDMERAWQEYAKMAETQIGFNYCYEFKAACRQYKCGSYQEASYGFLKIHKKLEPKVQKKLANPIEILYWHRSLKLLKEMPKERQKCEEVKEIVLKSESEVAWSDFKESLFVQRFFDKEERTEFAGYFKRVLRGA